MHIPLHDLLARIGEVSAGEVWVRCRLFKPGRSALGSLGNEAQHEHACEVREGAKPNEPPGETRESRRKG